MDIKQEVRRIVVEQLGVDPGQVVDGASFIDDLGADSLAIVELILAFEERFGVSIPEDVSQSIVTVGDVVAYLSEHQSTLGGAARAEAAARP
jgi:acyl carrier protein